MKTNWGLISGALMVVTGVILCASGDKSSVFGLMALLLGLVVTALHLWWMRRQDELEVARRAASPQAAADGRPGETPYLPGVNSLTIGWFAILVGLLLVIVGVLVCLTEHALIALGVGTALVGVFAVVYQWRQIRKT